MTIDEETLILTPSVNDLRVSFFTFNLLLDCIIEAFAPTHLQFKEVDFTGLPYGNSSSRCFKISKIEFIDCRGPMVILNHS